MTEHDKCLTCGEGGYPENECPKSERPCGHHCNCSWIHDHCHWCGIEIDEDDGLGRPAHTAHFDREAR